MKIDCNDFNFLCLRVGEFNGFEISEKVGSTRTVWDYEIEYFIKSEGGVEINGKYESFEAGSINFRKPTQIVKGIFPYQCIMICFDVLGDKSKIHDNYSFGSFEKSQHCFDNYILNTIPNKISVNRAGIAGTLIKQIYDNYLMKNSFVVKVLLYRLILEMYSVSQENEQLLMYPDFIKNALVYIHDNYYSDINADDIAFHVSVSTSYFYGAFKKYIGSTPNRYINNLRLNKAKQLLLMTNDTISSIGEACGIYDAVYFSYWFRFHSGISPKEFRLIQRANVIR